MQSLQFHRAIYGIDGKQPLSGRRRSRQGECGCVLFFFFFARGVVFYSTIDLACFSFLAFSLISSSRGPNRQRQENQKGALASYRASDEPACNSRKLSLVCYRQKCIVYAQRTMDYSYFLPLLENMPKIQAKSTTCCLN
jgi:hypothetical protein